MANSGRRTPATGLAAGPAALPPVLLLALVLLAGCESVELPAPDAWTIGSDTTAAGYVVVRHTPPADGIVPAWILEPELTFGVPLRTEPDTMGVIREPEAFERIGGVAPLPAGGIVVLDTRAQELRIFDSTGVHLRTFGGRGADPGQFNEANGFVLTGEGRIVVHDPRNLRLTVFDPEGGLVRTQPIDVLSFDPEWSGRADGAGGILESTVAVEEGQVVGALRSFDGEARPTGVRTLPSPPPAGTPTPNRLFEWERGSVRESAPIPWTSSGFRVLDPPDAYWELGPGETGYRIARVSLDGDTLLVIESARPAVPVLPIERDSVLADLRERSGGAFLDPSRIPVEKAAVEGAHVDDRRRLWVRVASPPGEVTWDLFGPDGHYEGTVLTYLGAPPVPSPVVRGDRVWLVQEGGDRVPRVVRASLRPLLPAEVPAEP